ncbi:MAG: tetratricopeptide repeat protein [Anaerolineales bacterium]|nr:tetratricopeptide repeat protein [Anaerolineales bacterium]
MAWETLKDLPAGTVTFLFTDIEGSTELLKTLGDAYATLLGDQREILRACFTKWNGKEVDTQGDAFFYSFPRATEAVSAAVEAQLAIAAYTWPEDAEVHVRMGLHTGEPQIGATGYVGIDVHRAARICHVGHGGQALLSETTAALVRNELPEGVGLRDLGDHRLKDLLRPEPLHQLVIPELPADYPPLNSLDAHPNNLPIQPTPLLGREEDLANARDQMLRPEVRLLTLTGPGGIGKTRLGMQLAAELADEFPDGVFFVPLAPISDPSLVCSTVAKTLTVREHGSQPILETLKEFLRDKKQLHLLDNFEHVIEAAPELAELLETCSRIKFLITSREALHLRVEHECPVQPLAVPDFSQIPPVELLSQSPAVELFAQRAQAVKPDFSITEENAQQVTEICLQLDGLPLSIELAAARVKVLPPSTMLERLVESDGGASLRLLTRGARDAPERHYTLHAAIDWSYALLDGTEQELFRSLSVFAGGFTLPAAHAVCCVPASKSGYSTQRTDDFEVMEGITSLLDKSLLRHDNGLEGEPRFIMLKMIREFALDKLVESGQEEGVRERYANYFLEVAVEAKPKLRGPEQGVWLEILECEHNNLRAALDWFLGQAEAKTAGSTEAAQSGLRLASVLWLFWDTHGYVSEGRRWFQKVLEVDDSPVEERVDALVGAAWLAARQGDVPESRQLYKQGLGLARQLEYKPGMARSLDGLGYLLALLGDDVELVEARCSESLELWREIGDKGGIASALGPLAKIASDRYDFTQAILLFEESLSLFRQVGDTREIAGALWNIGHITLRLGDYDKAKSRFEESRALYEDLKDVHGVATQLRCLGELERAQGNSAHARALYEEALASFRTIGDKGCVSDTLAGLGRVARDQGDHSSAISFILESLSLAREIGYWQIEAQATRLLGLVNLAQGDMELACEHLLASLDMERQHENREGIATSLDGLAVLAEARKEFERAAILSSAADRLRVSIGVPQAPVDRIKQENWKTMLQQELGEAAFIAAQHECRELTVDQVVDLAMESEQ